MVAYLNKSNCNKIAQYSKAETKSSQNKKRLKIQKQQNPNTISMGTSQSTCTNSALLWHTNIRCANEKQTSVPTYYLPFTSKLIPLYCQTAKVEIR